MSFFEWTQKLDIGVGEMNDEHKVLIGLMNKLHDLNAKNAATWEIEKALTELGSYTTKHFSDEEAYMAKISYPGLTTHKIIHKDLLEKFGAHVEAFKTSQKLAPDFFSFLTIWLNAHIQGIDTKYGEFSKKQAS